MTKTITQVISDILVDDYGVELLQIKPESEFLKDFEMDSLDRVELIMQLENHYKIVIPEEEAEKIKTVQSAVTYIERNINS